MHINKLIIYQVINLIKYDFKNSNIANNTPAATLVIHIMHFLIKLLPTGYKY